jgi:hypothetical protein
MFVLTAAFATNANAQVRRPLPDDSARLRLEAINLLQGHDTLPFLDTARVRLVAGALRAVRRELPQLADIPAGPDRSFLMLVAADSALDAFVRNSDAVPPADPVDWTAPVSKVGVPAIDSLNRVFHVERAVALYYVGRSMLTLYFRQPVDARVVARSYSRVPQVAVAWPPTYSDGSYIVLIPKGHRLLFVFQRGGGDCPAGCTEWDYYYATFDTVTHSVTLKAQVPDDGKWEEPLLPWDVPTRYSIDPYPTIDSLYAGTRAKRWWYRQHAVYVLGVLLSETTRPWYNDSSHYSALRQAAIARRRESYGALINRLGDKDPDVARVAHKYLRELTGQTFPGGEAGIAEWRKWQSEAP